MTERTYRRAVTTGLLIMLAPLALSLVTYASGAQKNALPVTLPSRARCILDTPNVRSNHMTYLKQRRDEVVRDGRRLNPYVPRAMDTCKGCHGDKAQFCDKCHTRAGVNLDCFGCHTY
jgi:hypothetical protein